MSDLVKKWILSRRESGFPNINAGSFFSPFAQVIGLKFPKADYDRIVREERHVQVASVQAVLAHEMTHWEDLIGTLWGREHLRGIYQGLRLLKDEKQIPVDDTWRLLKIRDDDRRLKIVNHFMTLRGFGKQAPPPWNLTTGSHWEMDLNGRLDRSRPFMFVGFAKGAHQIGDVPLTVAGLLETTAFAAQFARFRRVATAFVSEDNEDYLNSIRQMISTRFDPRHAQFSAPYHFCKDLGFVDDVFDTIEVAGFIATLSLNLNGDHFDRIRVPDFIRDNCEEDLHQLIANRDRGFAFASICGSLQEYAFGFKPSPLGRINHALLTCGLPDAETIMSDAFAVMEAEASPEGETQTDLTERYLLRHGVEVAKARFSRFGFGDDGGAFPLYPAPIYDAAGELWTDERWWEATNQVDRQKLNPERMVALDTELSNRINEYVAWLR